MIGEAEAQAKRLEINVGFAWPYNDPNFVRELLSKLRDVSIDVMDHEFVRTRTKAQEPDSYHQIGIIISPVRAGEALALLACCAGAGASIAIGMGPETVWPEPRAKGSRS